MDGKERETTQGTNTERRASNYQGDGTEGREAMATPAAPYNRSFPFRLLATLSPSRRVST
ncbi:hypothetical protein E2C01_093046 [Portunus trituberculatus]|uniref:Uncharacterized protein n=1 Tax=Portunus trituberculatus TaxID=210409 RepID=A0A5B7JSA7_PORTR|nr:hypothetical protein [Portunus trituberculatus]